ncbi:cytochrome P450 [Crepidotus variabilis]|uniref:Cytochrome P450 n=1 Tax=Crepidotus variabilis TaxID=179855 RepID=A0A9P6JP15_9AGAR|nr:cytochrome P450 [Crepidotus variabilis]
MELSRCWGAHLIRLPLISDKPSLPYVRSVLAEVFRWAPAVPLCVPHVLSKDDTYNDYVFKKGTIFMPNIWGLLHDPETYPDPMTFKPECFNGDDIEMEKAQLAFGFGRRVCPGRYFADGFMFALMATFLATCEILPGLNERGEEVMPRVAYTPGAITFPEAFPIRFKARSPQATALLAAISSVME